MKRSLLLIVLATIIVSGCASHQLANREMLTRFDPIMDQPQIKTFYQERFKETFVSYEASEVRLVSALFESQSLLLLPITIFNKTNNAIMPADYSVALYDGRDMKQIKMLTRDDLLDVKAKLQGRPSDGNIETKVINSVMDSLTFMTGDPDKQLVMQGLDLALYDYFSFRPIYPHEKRYGILCFILDFKAEYPITLNVRVGAKNHEIRFLPKPPKT
ncbi:hypothetical protein A2311_01240 [candidate division WOR-1 bacterium RIFOXYB2_FULL_48_7]|uniref:Uncharacterized protein n=1 Tax=candidate division WOR-1 bacterium RIFOXYB2_FULL_48_7 TaxID=1802583 RepID=A0A1F4TNL0_UNCSA|nr:MAG: hypothetical protein A2311_01240 [candidate division WOR-1 bacterium RIFOXYB2_FULL_48_7]